MEHRPHEPFATSTYAPGRAEPLPPSPSRGHDIDLQPFLAVVLAALLFGLSSAADQSHPYVPSNTTSPRPAITTKETHP